MLKTEDELVKTLTDERDALSDKCERLERFTVSEEFNAINEHEQVLLKEQLFAMLTCVRILDARLLLRNEVTENEE